MPDLILNNVGGAGPLYARLLVSDNGFPPVHMRSELFCSLRTITPVQDRGFYELGPDLVINGEQAAMLLVWMMRRFHPELHRYGFKFAPGEKAEINMPLYYLRSEIEQLENGLSEEELVAQRQRERGRIFVHKAAGWIDADPDNKRIYNGPVIHPAIHPAAAAAAFPDGPLQP